MGSKVLVIHPADESTDFLKFAYKDKGYDIINDGNISKEDLTKAIEAHDKIIMMGHGTSGGLINPFYYKGLQKNYTRPYMIDYSFAKLLSTKETVSIWCNSDGYFASAGIPGFHTGMIISECREQYYVLGEVVLNERQQLYNMINFATIINDCIDKPAEEMKAYILEKYNYPDKVTQYNRQNIIVL